MLSTFSAATASFLDSPSRTSCDRDLDRGPGDDGAPTTFTRRHALAVAGGVLAISMGIAASPSTAQAATTGAGTTGPATTGATTTGPGPWGGYTNGKIPLKAMTAVADGYLRADAAAGFTKMAAAFAAKFGTTLSVTSAYREYATQLSIFVARYTPHRGRPGEFWSGRYWILKKGDSVAAIPGTSNHGWGLAIDYGSGVEVAGSAEKKWADANGPTFGWYPIGNDFGEPWHFEFTPPKKSSHDRRRIMPLTAYETAKRKALIQMNRS